MVDALTLALAAAVLIGGSYAGSTAIHATHDAVLRRTGPAGRHRASGRRR